MKNVNSKVALGNQGDQVMLTAPDNTPVQRMYRSEEGPVKDEPEPPTPTAPPATPSSPSSPPPPPKSAKPKPLLEDFAPLVNKTSVHRDSIFPTGRFVSHMESEHAPFSPGVYVVVRAPVKKQEDSKPSP